MNGEIGNLVYAELTVVSDWEYADINFYELYDIDADPFQLKNIYHTVSVDLQQQLHKQLRQHWACSGTTSSPSTCL